MPNMFIEPEKYTTDIGPVARLTLEDAKRLQYLVATQDDRIHQIEQWLKEDSERGIVSEDYDED